MPRDTWKKANDRCKYGPARPIGGRGRAKKSNGGRRPSNFQSKGKLLYVVYAGTPIRVICPDGKKVEMKARKNLRFGSESKELREDGHHTFKRYGHYLIVRQELIGRQSTGS